AAGLGNLIEDNGPAGNGYTGGVVSAADPNLAPLAHNGGPPFPHPPPPGPPSPPLPGAGPAIDAGSTAAAAGLMTDQRGFAPRASGTVDVGAVEVGALAAGPGPVGPGPVGPGTVTRL